MTPFFFSVLTQGITFLPLAFGISISYRMLRATDMTLDGSFVLGACVFAKLIVSGYSPLISTLASLFAGALAGVMVSLIQRGGKVDALLAGILATFILTSGNLIIMGKPNIGLLDVTTMFSAAFNRSEILGWLLVAACSCGLCALVLLLMQTRIGLTLRALGDNPQLLQRLGKNIEFYRAAGFALTNLLAAGAGCITAQTVGYADISMGLGMTLTGIGAIILGQQIVQFFLRKNEMRLFAEAGACLAGVLLYFFAINLLLRLDVNPVYLKLLLGMTLIVFLRTAMSAKVRREFL